VMQTKVEEITDAGVVVTTPEGPKTVPADTVVVATMQSVQDLFKGKKGAFVIGDAVTVRRGNSAILDGYRMGMRL